MSSIDPHDAIVRRLLAPGRFARAVVVGAFALVLVCCAHAVHSVQRAQDDSTRALVRRLHLSDLALVPDEDLRHPGWGRAEQGRAGQPGLPDPRGATRLVRPMPLEVSR